MLFHRDLVGNFNLTSPILQSDRSLTLRCFSSHSLSIIHPTLLPWKAVSIGNGNYGLHTGPCRLCGMSVCLTTLPVPSSLVRATCRFLLVLAGLSPASVLLPYRTNLYLQLDDRIQSSRKLNIRLVPAEYIQLPKRVSVR